MTSERLKAQGKSIKCVVLTGSLPRKVDGQWKLFALVHNIEKWANYRKAA